MSSKRRKQEVVEPDFSLFDNPQTGYSAFEGLNIEEITKAASSLPSIAQDEISAIPRIDLPSEASTEALPAENFRDSDLSNHIDTQITPIPETAEPPPLPLATPDILAKASSPKTIKPLRQAPASNKPVFVFKSDWELLLSAQQFTLLEYLVGLNTSEIWIQGAMLEQETGIPLSTIKRSIALFRSKKFIKKVDHKYSGGERHSIIHLNTALCQKALQKTRIKYNTSNDL